jgi:hypothetical protein
MQKNDITLIYLYKLKMKLKKTPDLTKKIYNPATKRYVTPTEKKNETKLFIFIYLKTMF